MTEAIIPPRVLIVDDDQLVLQVHARALAKAGFDVQTAADGTAAMSAIHQGAFDVILSDIDMPGMSGIALLERVRSHDVDVPVILITGSPSIVTAIEAVNRGALRYLSKPVGLQALVKITRDAVRLHHLAIAKRLALAVAGQHGRFAGDQAALNVSLDRALDSMRIVYQPVVCWSTRTTYGYEALLRSPEPSLPNPGAVIDAAERLGRLPDLGRRVRALAVEPIGALPDDLALFVNLHPFDLIDDAMLSTDAPLARTTRRVILEVTERAALDRLPGIRARIGMIRDFGFRFALDDFGAGYGGLTSFALLEPEVVKIDMGLIRGIEREPTKRALVKTMAQMCAEMGVLVIAEGVETVEERDELVKAGCDMFQGYLFSRPGDPFPTPSF